MANFRKLLVIGNNHAEIAAKYSADKPTDEHVKYKLTEAPKLHIQYIKTLESIIKAIQSNPLIPNREQQLEYYQDMYNVYTKMDDFDFYQELTSEYEHNEDGDTITTENPDAHYECQRCYDEEIRKNQMNESPFASPLILKNGLKAYSAKVGDVDWSVTHLGTADVYDAVWEICVNGREPQTKDEQTAKQVMSNKKEYFKMFNNKEEYVNHNSAFWCYGVATEDNYIECNGRDIDWTNTFYDKYIKPLSDDTVISVYEMRLL